MSRRLLPVAAAALLALLALAALQGLRGGPPPTDAAVAAALAAELRCPDCQGLSIAESHTAAAVAIRQRIAELVADGATPDEVRAHFVARYGEWILLRPTAPVTWWLPGAAVLAGALVAGWWLLARRRTRAAEPTASTTVIDPAQRDRLRAELEELDA